MSIKKIDIMIFLEHNYFAYPKGVSQKICNEIIKEGESKIIKQGRVFGTPIPREESKRSKTLKNLYKVRNSQTAWLNNFWIYKEIRPFIWASNKQAKWNIDYDTIQHFQFTKYEGDSKQHYSWHADAGTPKKIGDKIRKLSTIVMLSDPKDFEGGDLEFYDYSPPGKKNKILKTNDIKQKGTIITFPSFIIHRVLPVTKGTRYSLVVWHTGPQLK